MGLSGAAYLWGANDKKPKLCRSGIEAEDAAPTGLFGWGDPFATNRPLLRS